MAWGLTFLSGGREWVDSQRLGQTSEGELDWPLRGSSYLRL